MTDRRLNLACGHDIRSGWVNLDRQAREGVDVVATVPPIPFPDGHFDHILASHFLEHVPNGQPIIDVMNECHRVLRPGGTMHVEVPYWQSELYVRDPTHVAPWNPDKFAYFTDEYAYLGYGIAVWRSATAVLDDWVVKADLTR